MMKKMLLTTALAALVVTGCQSVQTLNEPVIPAELTKAVQAFTQEDVSFQAAFADLNNDGINDGIVLLEGTNWCGSGGCTLLVFEGLDNGSYKLASKSTVASAPVYVLEATSHGWSDLSVYTSGKGQVILKWGGSNYPSNPSLQPTLIIDSKQATPAIPRNVPN